MNIITLVLNSLILFQLHKQIALFIIFMLLHLCACVCLYVRTLMQARGTRLNIDDENNTLSLFYLLLEAGSLNQT